MERALEHSIPSSPAWLRSLLENKSITDICINGYREIHFDDGGALRRYDLIPPQWSEADLRTWVLDALASAGKSWNAKYPFIDAALPSGHRIHVAFPPASKEGLLISLRRLPSAPTNSGALHWEESRAWRFLSQAVSAGDSILVCGATGSGKTTLANDLLSSVPEHERVICLEDTPELSPKHPHFVSLVSRPPNADGFGEITLRDLLKQTLRMRPDRIVIGECRGAEVLDLLQILNTGHRGALATIHANSPRDALRRLELLCLLAGGASLPIPAIRDLIASGLRWIAHVTRKDSRRFISGIYGLEGREGDTILMRAMLKDGEWILKEP